MKNNYVSTNKVKLGATDARIYGVDINSQSRYSQSKYSKSF